MKKTYILIILIIVTSCSNSLNGLSDNSKIQTYKSLLISYFSDNNLINSIVYINKNIIVKFEDNKIIEMETDLVSINDSDWSTQFTFADNSIMNIGTVGNSLQINYDKDINSIVPLSRNFNINLPFSGIITWETHGKNGKSSNIISGDINSLSGDNSFFVHGLYIDSPTDVTINYKNNDNILRYTETFTLTSNSFVESFNQIDITVTKNTKPNNQRFILFAHRSGSGPLIIDQFGDIRYYLDKKPPSLDRPLYGLKQTNDGSIVWSTMNIINEYALDGTSITNESIPEKYGSIHHDIIKYSPNRYFLTVNNSELTTIEDIVILYDVESDSVIKEWDLNLSVPKSNYFIGSDGFTQTFNDWFHTNAIDYVNSDNTLLLSGQRSGVVKVSWDNELIWFLTDINRYLNEPDYIKNKILFNQFNDVITWGQHSIKYNEKDFHYYLFDNGLGRNYEHKDLYSRGVKFKVDETDFSYSVTDTFGAEYHEYHSPIISGIDFNDNGYTLNLFGSIGYELTYKNNKDWLGDIWKDPQPDYGAVIQEYNDEGVLILEFKISSLVSDENHRFYMKDPGIYRASYVSFN